jgi:hypothetical protein
MEFNAAFTLLKKFTVGIPNSLSESETIDDQDVVAVANYLGVELPTVSLLERIEILETELFAQNKFLTANLKDNDIEQSELYSRSQFVREVILNNRARRGAK